MKKHTRSLLTAAAAGVTILATGCTVAGHTVALPTSGASTTACEGSVVTVMYERSPDCDVVAPQRLDVTYPHWLMEDTAGEDCDASGGVLVDDPAPAPGLAGFVCQDIDY
jgi:hypothetical protein